MSAESRATPVEEIERRFRVAGIETRYYNPQTHVAAFGLPEYIRALMG